MKNLCLFLIMVLTSCKVSQTTLNKSSYQKWSETGQDTIAYFNKNFIGQKNKYINKELNILLKNIEPEIKYYVTGVDFSNLKVTSLSLFLNSENDIHQRLEGSNPPPTLVIAFADPFPEDMVIALRKKNKRKWTQEERDFFGKKIIKDLVIPDQNPRP